MRINAKSHDVLERAIESGTTPCAVVLVSGQESAEAFGVVREGGSQATPATLFDLASLTKVVATLPSLLRLASEGELSFDDRVGKFFSNAGWFQTPSLADATVRQLLSHTSGLPPWRPLFAQLSDRRTALGAVLQTPLEQPGQHAYSDLGFMLLGGIAERVSTQRLGDFVRNNVFEPLGMSETRFGPIVDQPDIAPTEDCGWRGRLLRGEVHDENATVWDDVAGHAGLFGSAADLGRYCQAWLDSDARLGREELLVEATREQARGEDGTRRGLGWQLESRGCWAGKGASGYGHTGFTGTSIWVEPAGAGVSGAGSAVGSSGPGSYAVLLTNRVHPHRALRSGIAELRASFHEALREDQKSGEKS